MQCCAGPLMHVSGSCTVVLLQVVVGRAHTVDAQMDLLLAVRLKLLTNKAQAVFKQNVMVLHSIRYVFFERASSCQPCKHASDAAADASVYV